MRTRRTASTTRTSSRSISLSASGGDLFLVRSTQERTRTLLQTGDGDDTVLVGSNAQPGGTNTGGTVNSILGLLTVDGGTQPGDHDRMVIDDTADPLDNIGLLTRHRLTGLGMGGILDPSIDNDLAHDEEFNKGITYFRLEDLSVALGSGVDDFSIKSTHRGTTNVEGRGGNDVINIGAKLPDESTGILNEILGRLTVVGGDGADTLNVRDDGDVHGASQNGVFDSNGTLTRNQVLGLDMPQGVSYLMFETLEMRLGVGGDKLFIESTHAGVTRVFTGDAAPGVPFDPSAGKTVIEAESGHVASDGANLLTGGATGVPLSRTTASNAQDALLNGHRWDNIATESTGVGTFTGASGNYLQVLQNHTTSVADAINHNAGVLTRTVDPNTRQIVEFTQATAAYDIHVGASQKGLYDLNLRVAGLDENSNSLWVQILRKVGLDKYESISPTVTDNLLSGNNDGLALFTDTDGAFQWLSAGLWDLLEGDYRIQLTMRESGVAVDQLRIGLFQQKPGDDEINVKSIGGIVEVNAGSGDDTFHVNYEADGLTQTDQNGIGTEQTDLFGPNDGVSQGGLARRYTLSTQVATPELLTVTADGVVLRHDQVTIDLASNTVFVNFESRASQVEIKYLTTVLDLHGQHGSDRYVIGLAGQGQAVINVVDHRPEEPVDPDNTQDTLTVNGTNQADDFLLRPHTVVSFSHVAPGVRSLTEVERVNYDGNINGGLAINGREGDDHFTLDDNDVLTTINGDAGNDTFQVGQIFQSRREANANLTPEDQFATILTTRGYLSNGVSVATTLNGGSGDDEFVIFHTRAALGLNGGLDDDRFTVRAFVTVDEDSSKERFTNVNGGQGADFIAYAVNAPINIDGGEGFDTVTILGTEFGDDFVVTDIGTFGAGLFIQYVGIEQLEVNGGEGNDTFFVLSTSDKIATVLIGGLGSDTFNVGGTGNGISGDPVSVVSNDLRGHSGIITQEIESVDQGYANLPIADIGTNIADNDEAGIVLTPIGGATRVFENKSSTPVASDQARYSVVLTRQPSDTVRVTISPPAPTEEETQNLIRGISVNPNPLQELSNPATTLFFTRRDWFVPQIVTITALPDNQPEGTRYITLQHSTIEGNDPGARVTITPTANGRTQTIAHNGIRGTFTINVEGFSTGILPYNASAADVKKKLELLANVGTVNVTGTGTDADPWAIQFLMMRDPANGNLAARDVAPITVDGRQLFSPYDSLPVRSVVVEVIDDDTPSVVVSQRDAQNQLDSLTQVIEGGAGDHYDLVLTHAPTADVTVRACTTRRSSP